MKARTARRTLLVSLVLLSGCATWEVDRPGFQMKALEWVHVEGENAQQRLQNLCAVHGQVLSGCAIRIKESGLCLVYSIYSQVDAHYVYTWDGHSLYQHEVGTPNVPGHCGGGRPNGYTNHPTPAGVK